MIDKINKDDDDNHHAGSWLERLTSFIAGEPQNREQLMEILRDAEERDIVSAEMLGMIERILQVSEMQVREIMVPKAQMVVVNQSASIEELLPIVLESGHSRFPVIGDDSNNIIGILLAKDLLKYYYKNEKHEFRLMDVVRPATFTPQSKRLDILLREFRINRNHLAVVLDEYGHVAGLLTIEDVLEQIVGEIEDEYDIDEEDSLIRKHDDGSFVVKAQTPIDEFNEYFNTAFSEEEFDTIGGIILQSFGRLPKRGEAVKIGGWRFRVLQCDKRRIYLLDVKPVKVKK